MRNRRLLTTISAAVFGLTAMMTGPLWAQEERNYILATASTGGTYYPVGVALSTLVKVKLQPGEGIGLSAINSAGSAENVKLLREDEVQFAILQGLYGYYAWQGAGPISEPQEQLRSVTMLWQNVEHHLVSSEFAETGTVSDLVAMKGESMAMGQRNSGTIGSNRVILGNLGVDIDEDYDLFYAGYTPSAEALQDGRVAGISTPAGVPVSAVTQALASMGDDATLLRFTDEQAEQADGDFGIWTPYNIPAETYPGQTEAIQTIAQPNLLAVRADVPEEDIYRITRTVYENLGFLRGIHQATNAMALEKAIAGLPMPLHPGAARYYREQGIEIPDNLDPDNL